MNRKLSLALGILVIVAGIVATSVLFTVHQTQQAIVLQFGDPRRVVTEPGLNWKLPFIQDVLFYEKRVLNLDPPVESILLSDQTARSSRAHLRASLLSLRWVNAFDNEPRL